MCLFHACPNLPVFVIIKGWTPAFTYSSSDIRYILFIEKKSMKWKIKNYFNQEISQRKSCSKKLSKYVAAFDFIDKILIVLSTTTGGLSVISFMSVVGAPVAIASRSFSLNFSLTAGINKKLLSITRSKK